MNETIPAQARLTRLLNLRAEELPGLAFLYALAIVVLTGITWGETIVIAAFLQHVGVGFLPAAFVINALASIVGLSIYAGFSDRVAERNLFAGLLGVSVAGILVGLLLLAAGPPVAGYLVLYLVLNVALTDAFNIHWASYVNGFYDSRAAKRIVPVLSTATRVSGIFAGLTIPLLNRVLSPEAIIGVWLVTLLVAAGMIWVQPRWVPRAALVAASQPGALHHSYARSLGDGYRYVAASPFLRIMAVATLLVAVWLALVNYQVSAIFLDSLQTTVAIANFVGVLGAVANLVALPVQLLLLSRMISGIGLANSSLVFPIGAGVVSGGLLFAPGLAMASVAHIARTTFRTSFRSPIESLLYNAVPLAVKGRARAFIGGLVTPLGALLGGLLLLTPLAGRPAALGVAICVLAAGIVAASLAVRRHYTRALVALLEQEDYTPVLSASFDGGLADLGLTDPATVRTIRARLEGSTSPDLTVFLARLYVEAAGKAAVPTLAAIARQADDARLRGALVDVLTAGNEQDGVALRLYADLLDDADAAVRRSALAGLARAGRAGEPDGNRILQLLVDPDTAVRGDAVALLLAGTNAAGQAAARQALEEMLVSAEAGSRVQGVRILGRDASGSVLRLSGFLHDPSDEVRLEAAWALENAPRGSLPPDSRYLLVRSARGLLADPVERVRQSAVTLLAHFAGEPGGQSAQEALLEALADSSPAVRAVAVKGLAAAGKSSIALVQPRLNSPDPGIRRAAAMILGSVDPRQFTTLVESHVLGDLLSIYRNACAAAALEAWDSQAGIALLRCALAEQNDSLREGIFNLIATVHDPAAVALVRETCGNPNRQVRANAIEALEAMTSPRIASLVSPLYELEGASALVVAAAEDTWNLVMQSPGDALKDLLTNHPDAWLRGIAAFALARLASGAHPGIAAADGEFQALLALAAADADPGAHPAMGAGRDGRPAAIAQQPQEALVLSVIEKVILMKEVPFFQAMTVEQLRVLATVCEERFIPAGSAIVQQGDPGGTLHVIVSGRVAIERQKRGSSSARLATLGAHNYFGENNLFDGAPHSAAVVTLQDTQMLRLRREPLIALARQHPELSLALIQVLSQRLRDANDRIADLTRSKPKELHKLYDAFE